jgi:hypothetical protein
MQLVSEEDLNLNDSLCMLYAVYSAVLHNWQKWFLFIMDWCGWRKNYHKIKILAVRNQWHLGILVNFSGLEALNKNLYFDL